MDQGRACLVDFQVLVGFTSASVSPPPVLALSAPNNSPTFLRLSLASFWVQLAARRSCLFNYLQNSPNILHSCRATPRLECPTIHVHTFSTHGHFVAPSQSTCPLYHDLLSCPAEGCPQCCVELAATPRVHRYCWS
jgi:hypothetical protein